MKVQTFLDRVTDIFNIEHIKTLSFLLPLERGSFSASASANKDIQASIATNLNFSNGKILANASTSDPCSIKFESKNLLKDIDIAATIFNDDRRPFNTKFAYQKIWREYVFRQILRFSFKVIPSSLDFLDPAYFDTESVTKIITKNKCVRIGYMSISKSLSFDIFLNSIPNVQYGLNLNINKKQTGYNLSSNILSSTKFGETNVTTVYTFENKTLKSIIERNFNNKVLAVAMLGVSHIGKGSKFINKFATKFNIDPTSTLQIIAGLDRSLSGILNISHQDFLNFQFTASTNKVANGYENNFGASITFDLRNREEFQMF